MNIRPFYYYFQYLEIISKRQTITEPSPSPFVISLHLCRGDFQYDFFVYLHTDTIVNLFRIYPLGLFIPAVWQDKVVFMSTCQCHYRTLSIFIATIIANQSLIQMSNKGTAVKVIAYYNTMQYNKEGLIFVLNIYIYFKRNVKDYSKTSASYVSRPIMDAT